MVLMSAVTPAPEPGSNPAMLRTTGGVEVIVPMYRNPQFRQTVNRIRASFRRSARGPPGKRLESFACKKYHSKSLKIIVVQVLHSTANHGYLLLYKHLSYCYTVT